MTSGPDIATGATEIRYRDSGARIGGRIIHLASVEDNFERALCGKVREQPLEPNAQGDLCIVCAGIHLERSGEEWRW